MPQLWAEKLDFPLNTIDGRVIWETPLWIASGLLAVPLAWLFFCVGAGLFSCDRLLYRATLARTLVPLYASAMLVIIGSAPLFRMAEDYWFRRDTLNQFDPALPSWSRHEYRIAVQARKELREVMGYTR